MKKDAIDGKTHSQRVSKYLHECTWLKTHKNKHEFMCSSLDDRIRRGNSV